MVDTHMDFPFHYTGGWQKFTVFPGVSQLSIRVEGAGSGSGRRGGLVTGTLPINPLEDLWIWVGEKGGTHNGTNGGRGGAPDGARGGDGHNGKAGGDGGGGATIIRRGSRDGTIVFVAGGAGGDSGDDGNGGQGGDSTGEDGHPGDAGSGATTRARGGAEKNPGNGGTSQGGKTYAGGDAPGGRNDKLAGGGRGGEGPNGHGGGGGGGGYTGGGGGQASAVQNNPGGAPTRRFPGGGGGGGANYVGPYVNSGANSRGGGNAGHGRVVITVTSFQPPRPPSPPTDVTIAGLPETSEMATRSMGSVSIVARLEDADVGDNLRLALVPKIVGAANPWRDVSIVQGWYSTQQAVDERGLETGGVIAVLNLYGLPVNTLFEGELWAIDERDTWSARQDGAGNWVPASTSISFWTNRPPDPPQLLGPNENTQFEAGTPITFEWDFSDPDGGSQGGWELRWRAARTPRSAPGPWVTLQEINAAQARLVGAEQFKAGVLYEWTMRTMDPEGLWSAWQVPQSFYVIGDTVPPVPLEPRMAVGVFASAPTTFSWLFRDNGSGITQQLANLRYRASGTEEWITLAGDLTVPGAGGSWTLPPGTFMPGVRYDWQAQTRNSAGLTSDWSETATFWAVVTPGEKVDERELGRPSAKGTLGSGVNTATVYLRGGEVYRGRLSNITALRWNRRRDDISEAQVVIEGFDDDLLSLLAETHSWTHELVIFREANGVQERVWEGPITYIQDDYDRWTIQAKDPMAYASRRIIRQGYNDGYQVVSGVQTGLKTVVERSERTLINALAYDDPNVLPYLSAIKHPGDAQHSRIIPDYARTVWEDLDDLAANSGLDYTVVGRRILLWDTHRPIGRLPELRNESFSAPPRITEYGMLFCNHFGVTDGSGVYGVAERGIAADGEPLLGTGYVEMLATAYGVDTDEVADASALTTEQRSVLEQTYSEQADRNIAHRWPLVYQVRLPDNTRLMPEVDLGINQLVPGVWMPIRAKSRVRDVAQWQKLDQVSVEQDDEGERVQIILSPAPNGGEDPDAAASAEED